MYRISYIGARRDLKGSLPLYATKKTEREKTKVLVSQIEQLTKDVIATTKGMKNINRTIKELDQRIDRCFVVYNTILSNRG